MPSYTPYDPNKTPRYGQGAPSQYPGAAPTTSPTYGAGAAPPQITPDQTPQTSIPAVGRRGFSGAFGNRNAGPLNVPLQRTGPGSTITTTQGNLPPGPRMANVSAAGANISPFGGQNGDLRSAMVTPSGFDRIGAVGKYATDFSNRLAMPGVTPGQVNTAVNFHPLDTDVTAGGAIDPSDSADLSHFKSLQMGAADTLSSGPTRGQIAQKTLDAFDTRAEPMLRDKIRAVGQRAAELGRLGMGDTAVEALNPYTDYLKERGALSNELAARTAEGEISDRRNNLDQFGNLVGQTESINSGRRGELRGERDYQTNVQDTNIGRRVSERNTGVDVATGNANRAMADRNFTTGVDENNANRAFDAKRSALEAAMGQTGAEANDQAGARDEVRGERSYQQAMNQLALENAFRERSMSNGEQQDDFNRALAAMSMGYGNNPAGITQNAAGAAAGQAGQSFDSVGMLLAQILANRRNQSNQMQAA